jgi:sarcosine oxidase
MTQTADVVVIGLGAAGAACAFQLARRGASVVALDRHHPPHEAGSSHGGSRITRQAIGEGADYVPLVLRAQRLWREIEDETGETLFDACGALILGAPDGAVAGKPAFMANTIDAARRFAIPHEILSPDETMRRYPALALAGEETVYFEPGGGALFPERCVGAQIALARRHGAVIRTGETALALRQEGAGVRVVTDRGEIAAGQAVLAAGPWAPGLLGGPLAARLRIWRQVMLWFAPDDPAAFAPGRFPVFIWLHGPGPSDWFYGFPQLAGEAGIKIADERFDAPLARPEDQTQLIPDSEAAAMWARHGAGRVRGVSGRCVGARACLYTMAPDSRFLIGRDPARERVVVVSACSGHGFKHSAAVGDLVAEFALTGATPPELAPFAIP